MRLLVLPRSSRARLPAARRRRRTSATASRTTPGSAPGRARSTSGSTGCSRSASTLVRMNMLWSEVEPRQGAFDWSGYDAAARRAARAPHRARAHALLDAGLGERRARDERGADERRDVRELRAPDGAALSVRPPLADLERAEPAALAAADLAVDLRHAPAQPGVHGDPRGASRARSSPAASPRRARPPAASRRSSGSTAWRPRTRGSTPTRTTRTR